MTLGGLLKDMAYVGDSWFSQWLYGHDKARPWDTVDWKADRDWESHSVANDSPEELYERLQNAVTRSRTADRSDVGQRWIGHAGAACVARWSGAKPAKDSASHHRGIRQTQRPRRPLPGVGGRAHRRVAARDSDLRVSALMRERHPGWHSDISLVGSGTDERKSMLGWVDDIEELTVDNTNFRTVVYTGAHSQLTVMSVPPGGEVGWEAHSQLDQFLRLEQGKARLDFGESSDAVDESHEIEDDWALIVPAGVWHNVVNIGEKDVKLYSIYSPPEHPDGTVHRTKAEADADEHHH